MSQNLKPTNPFICPLLTDMYQITMTYGYWRTGKHEQPSVFDLFIRKNPFGGEFTVFAGLEEALRFMENYHFTSEDIEFLKTKLPHAEPAFFSWLSQLNCSQIRVYAPKEGTVMFPRIPFLRIEGPLAICQLLETSLLCLINFATLIATNAARIRIAAGEEASLLEFGARRAQGPDGAVSASRYSYVGGFDGTSNMLAGQLFGIRTVGTMAHSFVTSFSTDDEPLTTIKHNTEDREVDLLKIAKTYQTELGYSVASNAELRAFVAYAICYPHNFLALVDTYNTLQSGVPNFICVSLALHEAGYKPIGLRLDSGDLAYLSYQARQMLIKIGEEKQIPYFKELMIVASNDLTEATILSFRSQKHSINSYGVGTHLVTCQSQPALGGVYKLVSLDGQARIKLSEEINKVPLPGLKHGYRLYGEDHPLLDILVLPDEPVPQAGAKILCRHPSYRHKRCHVVPKKVEPLHLLVFDQGKIVAQLPSIHEVRAYVRNQLSCLRPDILRSLNPTPYKVSVSSNLFTFFEDLWLENAPIPEIMD